MMVGCCVWDVVCGRLCVEFVPEQAEIKQALYSTILLGLAIKCYKCYMNN